MTRGSARQDWDRFRDTFRGELVTPASPGYDRHRAVWNAMIDRHPALIARCADPADVSAAVRFARTLDLPVAVRGGGHSAAGKSVCDGVVIDLSLMKGIRVDPPSQVVTAQAGLLWADYDHETQSYGLATPGGLVSHTGIAGFTLGGGVGWLSRRFGLTCDNLIGADVVLADGRRVVASKSEHIDLLWALKGGGGNFGVVTSFRLQSYRIGNTVLGGSAIWPLGKAPSVLSRFAELSEDLPDELGIVATIAVQAPHPLLPPEVTRQRMLTIGFCWPGDAGHGREVLSPLLEFGSPAFAAALPLPYTAVQSFQDRMAPHGRRAYWKSGFIDALTPEVIEVLVDRAGSAPSAYSATEIGLFTGAPGRVAADSTAFGPRSGRFIYNINSAWEDPGSDDANIAYTRDFFDAMAPHSTGEVYVNFLSDEGEERVRAAYGARWARLADLKAKYDPGNFFNSTQNIVPPAVTP